MKIDIAALCVLAAVHAAGARDSWYDPELTLAGDVTVGTVGHGIADATVHVRLKARQWSLCWESAEGPCRATLTLPPPGRKDDIYIGSAVLTVEGNGISGRYSVDGDVTNDGYNSMKIEYDGVTATLMVGDEIAREIMEVPFGAGDVNVSVAESGKCRRLMLTQRQTDGGIGIRPGSLERMLLQVAASDDYNEGLWEYFGKDTDPSNATVGGQYLLATVRDGHDGYDIIYVSGAEADGGLWQPMAVKGHLSPTVFTNDYDLAWRDADGERVDGETYARLSDDRSLLMLGFAAPGATLRFRRVPRSQIIQKAGL